MAQSAANRVYQDFDPFFEWSEDEGSATLVVMLPGFTKEQLRVQVTSTPVLRLNGERQLMENTWRRFAKDFSIPPYCDINDVRAKFERGVLSVKFPKLITPAKPMPQHEAQAPAQDKQELPQKEREQISDEKEMNKTQESPQKEKEPLATDEKEKNNKTEEVAPKVQQGTTSFTQEKPKGKITQRLKTRVLDFTVSLRSAEDQDVKQGSSDSSKITKLKKPKILMNIIVAILLVMVLGLYIKNAFWSTEGGSKFHEF